MKLSYDDPEFREALNSVLSRAWSAGPMTAREKEQHDMIEAALAQQPASAAPEPTCAHVYVGLPKERDSLPRGCVRCGELEPGPAPGSDSAFEPTQAQMDAAVAAYVAEMDPELRGGLVPNAVRRGMWPALVAALRSARPVVAESVAARWEKFIEGHGGDTFTRDDMCRAFIAGAPVVAAVSPTREKPK